MYGVFFYYVTVYRTVRCPPLASNDQIPAVSNAGQGNGTMRSFFVVDVCYFSTRKLHFHRKAIHWC